MSEQPTPAGVEELMQRLRAEVARRKRPGASLARAPGVPAYAPVAAIKTPTLGALPAPRLPKAQFAQAASYQLNDFLALHDADFIEAAYWGLLRREADPSGRQHFLATLRDGSLSKIEILGRLRYSAEGRAAQVPVKGLATAFAVQHSYRLPIIGGLFALAASLLRLPRLVRSQQSLEGYQHMRNAQLESAISQLAKAATGHERAVVAYMERIGLTSAQNTRAIGSSLEAAQKQQAAHDDAMRDALEALQKDQQDLAAIAGSTERQLAALDQSLTEHADAAAERIGKVEDLAQHAEADRQAFAQRLEKAEADRRALDDKIGRNQQAQADAIAALRNSTAQASAEADKRLQAIAQMQNSSLQKSTEVEQRLATLAQTQQSSSRLATELQNALAAAERRLQNIGQSLQGQSGELRTVRAQIIERLARVEGRVHEQSQRLAIEMAVPAEPAGKSGRGRKSAQVVPPAALAPRFDRLYFAFESRFRGSRDDIRQRVAYYLPILRDSAVGKYGASVLDVGCGRGEWLELLRDEQINARGVDSNEEMVKQCVDLGLDVSIGDAIAYMRRLPDNALGAVTGFHIIEHVPLDTLLELLEQSQRVVQPGGVVIFETPNPENIVVGACNFYIDPTHQRPLPPVMTQFLVEAAGFVDVQVHRVNANLLPELFEEAAEDDPPALRAALAFLRSAFSCAPDYSVVGRVA